MSRYSETRAHNDLLAQRREENSLRAQTILAAAARQRRRDDGDTGLIGHLLTPRVRGVIGYLAFWAGMFALVALICAGTRQTVFAFFGGGV